MPSSLRRCASGLAFGLAVCALPVSAATPGPNPDAFDLAAAFAPAPVPGGAIVTGVFTEASSPTQLATFTGGALTVGFADGIVLSTGDVGALGGASPLSVGFAGTPSSDTEALLAQIPGLGSVYADSVRLSLAVQPDLPNNYVNFSFGYQTSEISPADRFGLFVNGRYRGLLAGQPVDQAHPWLAAAVPDIGYTQALYGGGNPLNPPAFVLSVAVPSPGALFTLDLVLADVFGDEIDTAVFLGSFSASARPKGYLAIPESRAWPLVASGGVVAFASWYRRRRQA